MEDYAGTKVQELQLRSLTQILPGTIRRTIMASCWYLFHTVFKHEQNETMGLKHMRCNVNINLQVHIYICIIYIYIHMFTIYLVTLRKLNPQTKQDSGYIGAQKENWEVMSEQEVFQRLLKVEGIPDFLAQL